MTAWKVFYGDGATFADTDGGPEDAPALNVQAIAVADMTVGRFIVSRYDFYWWESGRWWGGDIFGLWDRLARPGWSKVLFGRSLTNEQFDAVMERAVTDVDLPAKSAWSDAERGRGVI